MLLKLLAFTAFLGLGLGNPSQSIIVNGRLSCPGARRDVKAKVTLVDEAAQKHPTFDGRMVTIRRRIIQSQAAKFMGPNGVFEIARIAGRVMEPLLEIEHNCNSSGKKTKQIVKLLGPIERGEPLDAEEIVLGFGEESPLRH